MNPLDQKPLLTLIAAMDRNRLIGRNNGLPWRLPADLAHFKAQTLGKPILMGRKTCESLPFALPGRRNLVLTRNARFKRPGFERIELPQLQQLSDDELMIIGGASLYEQFLPQARRLLITCIEGEFEGDTWFPEWNEKQWRLVSRQEFAADAKNPHAYAFLEYQRIEPGHED